MKRSEMNLRVNAIYWSDRQAAFRIVARINGDNVFWIGFRPGSDFIDHGECGIDHLAHWANREATHEEIRQIPVAQITADLLARQAAEVRSLLAGVRDEDLVGELQRRGFKVTLTRVS